MSVRNQAFGAQLRRWREAKGLLQRDVADGLGVVQQTYSLWEKVGTTFDANRFAQLDAFYGFEAGTSMAVFTRLATEPPEDVDAAIAELRSEIASLQAEVARLAAERSTAPPGTTRSRGRSGRGG